MGDIQLEKLLPNLKGKLDPVADVEIDRAVRRIYEYIDMTIYNLKAELLASIQKGNLTKNDVLSMAGAVQTNDGLKKIVGSFYSDGYVTIRDNAGHSIKILTTLGE